MKFRSSGKSFPHFQGTLQERICHPARWCYKLPEEVGLDVGALLEPLGVALHAFRRSKMPETDATVVVFGAGAVGLLCAAVAMVKGAKKVVIADIDQGRLDFAVQNGFAHGSYLVPMKRGQGIDEELAIAKDTAANVGKVEGVGEVDVVFECTGVPSCVQAGIYVSCPLNVKTCEIFLTLSAVHKARRSTDAGRYGSSNPDNPAGRRSIERGRHRGSLPIREHLRREHRDRTDCREIVKWPRLQQAGHSQIQGSRQCSEGVRDGRQDQGF